MDAEDVFEFACVTISAILAVVLVIAVVVAGTTGLTFFIMARKNPLAYWQQKRIDARNAMEAATKEVDKLLKEQESQPTQTGVSP